MKKAVCLVLLVLSMSIAFVPAVLADGNPIPCSPNVPVRQCH